MTASRHPKTAERIASSLRRSIARGRLRPGDPLPSERELAGKYEVNRSSIREALKRLEAWGLVKIRHGGATRVSDFLRSAGLDLMPSLVEVGAKVDPGISRDLHEVRAMLLGWCAEQAARKAGPAAIARLDALSHLLDDDGASPSTLQELDYDFFQELVAISGNRLLGLFGNVVREVYSRGKGRYAELYSREVFDPAHHRRAVKAIRAGNPSAAGEAMRAHAASALRTVARLAPQR